MDAGRRDKMLDAWQGSSRGRHITDMSLSPFVLSPRLATPLVLLVATQPARPISALAQGVLDVKQFPERAVSLSCRALGIRAHSTPYNGSLGQPHPVQSLCGGGGWVNNVIKSRVLVLVL
jgi:hypothetical protein